MPGKTGREAGHTRPVILKTLESPRTLHGYASIAASRKTSEKPPSPSIRHPLPALGKLEQEGFIAAEWRQSEKQPSRQVLHAHRSGAEALAREAATGIAPRT